MALSSTPPNVCTAARVRKASRRVSQIYDRELERFGLTVTQFGLLGHVRRLDGIGISALADRLTALQTRYTAQFNALDQLLAKLQSTSNYLTQQLSNLPGFK